MMDLMLFFSVITVALAIGVYFINKYDREENEYN